MSRDRTDGHRGHGLAVIASGAFVTLFAHPHRLGRLPLQVLLREDLHADPSEMAWFFAVGSAAWHLKPVVGLLSDMGVVTLARRRVIIAAGAAAAALGWLGVALAPASIWPLAAATLVANMATVVGFSAVGGLAFAFGRERGLTGAVASIKTGALSLALLVAGPLGARLSHQPLAATCALGGALQLTLAVSVAAWSTGRGPLPVPGRGAPFAPLAAVVRARRLWITAGLVFLFFIGPAAGTPLYYFQSAELEFDPTTIGTLSMAFGGAGLIGSLIYARLAARVPLRRLLVATALLNAATAPLFVFYRTPESALAVTAVMGITTTPAIAALYDLANRSSPPESEALAFACIATVVSLTMSASDVLGSHLYQQQVSFGWLVAITAATTAMIAPLSLLLPRALVERRDSVAGAIDR